MRLHCTAGCDAEICRQEEARKYPSSVAWALSSSGTAGDRDHRAAHGQIHASPAGPAGQGGAGKEVALAQEATRATSVVAPAVFTAATCLRCNPACQVPAANASASCNPLPPPIVLQHKPSTLEKVTGKSYYEGGESEETLRAPQSRHKAGVSRTAGKGRGVRGKQAGPRGLGERARSRGKRKRHNEQDEGGQAPVTPTQHKRKVAAEKKGSIGSAKRSSGAGGPVAKEEAPVGRKRTRRGGGGGKATQPAHVGPYSKGRKSD